MNYYNANDAALTSVLTAFEPIESVKESREHAMNITVKEALRSRGVVAEKVILKELSQMIDKKVWTSVRMNVLTSKEKGVLYVPDVPEGKISTCRSVRKAQSASGGRRKSAR